MTTVNVGVTLKARAGQFVRDMRRSGNAVGGFHKKLADRRPIARSTTALRYQTLQFGKLKYAYDATGRSDTALRRQLGESVRKMRQARRTARQYGRSLRDTGKQARGLSGALAKLKGGAAGGPLGKLAGLVGGGLAIRQIAQIKKQENDALLRLGTVLPDGADRRTELRRSRTSALGAGRRNNLDSNAILAAEYALRSAGVDNARGGAILVNKLAAITGGSAEQVAETLSTARLNFAESTGRIGDLLAQTQLQYAVKNFGQLGDSLNEAVSGAVLRGVSLPDTLGALGAAHGAGLKGGRAGTALNAFLRQLPKASEQFGFDVVRRNDGSLNLFKSMQNLKKSLDKITDLNEKQKQLQLAFGDEGARFLPVLERLDEVVAGLGRLTTQSRGVVEEKHKDFSQNDYAQVEKLGKSFSALGSEIGDLFMPAVSAGARTIGAIIDWLTSKIKKVNAVFDNIGQFFSNSILRFALPDDLRGPRLGGQADSGGTLNKIGAIFSEFLNSDFQKDAGVVKLKEPKANLVQHRGEDVHNTINNHITINRAGESDDELAAKVAAEIRRQQPTAGYRRNRKSSFNQNRTVEATT